MIRRWRDHGRRNEPQPSPPAAPTRLAVNRREYRISLASTPPGIRLARRITVTVLTTWGLTPRTGVHDAAVLAVTELAANTVRHAAALSPSFELRLAADDRLDVGVRDSHPGLLETPSPDGTGGLAVLADLAHDLGGHLAIDPEPDGGKTVRVLLPLTTPAPEKS